MAEDIHLREDSKMRLAVTRFRRASIVNMVRTWRGLKSTARHAIKGEVHPDLPKEDMDYLHRRMTECVEGKGGEVSARARSAELGHQYMNLNKKGKERFLKMLGRDFNLEYDRVIAHLDAFRKAKNDQERLAAELSLREALNSPRLQILRQFNTLSDGFKFLVDMRGDLLSMKKDIYLERLERDLKFLLRSLFDIGLLDMSEISWDSPASLLEKLIRYEAVHEISSWGDLKNRLGSDRRCFAFFHNKMPDEPLIFIEVALVKGMADNIQELLNVDRPAEDPEEADTAIFYSINNTQKGLSGISFGNFLIKWVVAELSSTLKNLKIYSTLSPIPGFRRWLDPLLEKGDTRPVGESGAEAINRLRSRENSGSSLIKILNSEWYKDEKTCEVIKQPLMGLAAHYLVQEKKGVKALDPVAHFHLSNGACLERINWLADTSSKGMKESAGIMVNYLYKHNHIDDYHEAYTAEGKINISKQVKECLSFF